MVVANGIVFSTIFWKLYFFLLRCMRLALNSRLIYLRKPKWNLKKKLHLQHDRVNLNFEAIHLDSISEILQLLLLLKSLASLDLIEDEPTLQNQNFKLKQVISKYLSNPAINYFNWTIFSYWIHDIIDFNENILMMEHDWEQ